VIARRTAALACAVGLVAAACSQDVGVDPDDFAPATTTTVAPGEAAITIHRGRNSVLTAAIRVRSAEPVRPLVVATALDGSHRVRVPRPEEATTHQVIGLVGLREATTYRIEVRGAAALRRASRGLRFTTGDLPGHLPDLTAVAVGGRARRGVTLFDITPGDEDPDIGGQLVAVDQDGYVVWYHQDTQTIADVRQLPNGNILYNFGNIGAREIDVMGNLVREWTTQVRVDHGQTSHGQETYGDDAVVLDTTRLHHEVSDPLPDGNFLSLSMEVRDVDGFPDDLCPDDPLSDGPRPQRGDIVLEYTPEGEIVHEVHLLDSIDPVAHPGIAQCETKTDALVTGNQAYVDWTHANSATLFEEENAVLVSARNLNAVLALRWQDDEQGPAGELLWRLGPGGDFQLTQGEWFYGQHAPEVEDDGTILVYDNGTFRPGTTSGGGTGFPYSRAVQYRLDRSGPRGTWTARQVWEHRLSGPTGPVYASFLGDADDIGNDHVLIDHGAAVEPGDDLYGARIVEVVRSTGEVVLDIQVSPQDGTSWRSYRAEHLDTFYPRDDDGLPPAEDPPLP
jgi:arylsulfate sulfotransferase